MVLECLGLGVLVAIVVAFFLALVRTSFSLQPGVLDRVIDPSIWGTTLLLMVGIPGALLLGWREFTRGLSVGKRGFLAGLAYGLWGLSCMIVVPFLGAYPSLWAAVIHALLFGWVKGTSFWLAMYLLNLAVCPFAGLAFFRWLAWSLRSSRGEAH